MSRLNEDRRVVVVFLMFPLLLATTYLASGILVVWPLFILSAVVGLNFLESGLQIPLCGVFAILTSVAICAYLWPRGDSSGKGGAPTSDRFLDLYAVAALILPIALEVIWIESGRPVEVRGFPGYGDILSQTFFACVGAIVLAKPLRGRTLLTASVVYMPLMIAALSGFGLLWTTCIDLGAPCFGI